MGLRHAGWRPGAYPFDHVGQHVYVDGGSITSEEKLRFYLDDLRDSYLAYEGPETRKTTHITEFGWSTAFVPPEVQANNLLIAFDTFREVGYVARAYWFHAQDVPEADLYYGLADSSGRRKRAFSVYQDAATYDSPTDDPDEPANDDDGREGRMPRDGEGGTPTATGPLSDASAPRTTAGGRP